MQENLHLCRYLIHGEICFYIGDTKGIFELIIIKLIRTVIAQAIAKLIARSNNY
jgi:hypothetical protein